MAFKEYGTLLPHGAPVLRQEVIGSSVTITELDSVYVTAGFIALCTGDKLVFGHVKSIVTNDGVGMETTGAAGAASGSYVGTYTTAATNATAIYVSAVCDISKFTIYSADPDVTIGTTAGSSLLGYYIDLAREEYLDESTAATTAAMYFIHGLDPGDTGNALVNIYESQVFGV